MARKRGYMFYCKGADTIVFHHTGSNLKEDNQPQTLLKLHTGNPKEQISFGGKVTICRGWSDIGYHFFVRKRDIFVGRSLNRSGASVRGHNKNKIAVCVAGKDYATTSLSFRASKYLIYRILKEHDKMGEPIDNLTVHRHYANTECPSFSPLSDLMYHKKIDDFLGVRVVDRNKWDRA